MGAYSLAFIVTAGLLDSEASVLQEVNGVGIKNLRHLVEVLRDSSAPQTIFKLVKGSHRGQDALVFNREEIVAATEEVLNDNGIRHPYSSDLGPIWLRAAPR